MAADLHVLHAVSDMRSGGIENYIMNMYRNIDRDVVQFDFLIHHQEKSFFEEEIQGMGGSIYKFPVLDDHNVTKYYKELCAFFREHSEIGVVHGHLTSLSLIYLHAAAKEGVPLRISHAHSSDSGIGVKGAAIQLLSRFAAHDATVRLACSSEAGKWLFGRRGFTLEKNAIDVSRFKFNLKARERIRGQLGLSESFVIGHIGRFEIEKNQRFLLETLEAIRDSGLEASLVLVGEGSMKKEIEEYASSLRCSAHIRFEHVSNCPEDYYAAFDCFVLPSLREGLPLVGIEAQSSGLPCLFSEATSSEVAISDLARFVPLEAGASRWAEEIKRIAHIASIQGRENAYLCAKEAGYEAKDNAVLMSQKYFAGLTTGGWSNW